MARLMLSDELWSKLRTIMRQYGIYDKPNLRLRGKGATPLIPRKKNSKTGNDDMDWCLYKYRHLVENIFARLKHFRAIEEFNPTWCDLYGEICS